MSAATIADGRLVVAGQTYRYVPLSEVLTEAELTTTPYALRVLIENVARRAPAALPAVLARLRGELDTCEVPLHPNRIMLHDTTCLPALADFAGMRDRVAELGGDPAALQPAIPVDLTVDHSVIAEHYARPDAVEANLAIDFRRNDERYRFIKWAQNTLDHFGVIPPGTGIIHQINMESLATSVWVDAATEPATIHPDTLVATDSHTPMVNSIGVVGWGVGGLQGQAAMLGEPVTIAYPTVVGVRLTGRLQPGVTGTDLALTLTAMLRAHGVVDKFVEFHGDGARNLAWADRAAVSNMAPEYGATVALFPSDDETLRFLEVTGRPSAHIALVREYLAANRLLCTADAPAPQYDENLTLALESVQTTLAGPSLPHEKVALRDVPASFRTAAGSPSTVTGETDPVFGEVVPAGPVAVAAITSCTNTANPALMLQAGLLARNALRAGLTVKPWVKTTLSPGSRVTTEYLDAAGLLADLAELGFATVGYGCMTCIGNSGPLHPRMEELVAQGTVPAAVLSGNRNFAGRVHPRLRFGYLASPPLVIAYALAGTVLHDFGTEPLGESPDGTPIYLRDIWPADVDVAVISAKALRPSMFERNTAAIRTGTEAWRRLEGQDGIRFDWDPASTYIRRPSFLEDVPADPEPLPPVLETRALLALGDNVTTDHISPAGAIPGDSAAAAYLRSAGVAERDFNQYSTRRSNFEVMLRGAFTNHAVQNRLLPDGAGGDGAWAYTKDRSQILPVYDAAATYRADRTPLVIIAGANYGAGSSRDWAAKAPALLGVRAVIAESFERIHRSNLIGMGIFPLEFACGEHALALDGTETLRLHGLNDLTPGTTSVAMEIARADGTTDRMTLRLRLDTGNEVAYLRHGGTLPYVIRRTLANT
ncbi:MULTISPECIES: aconitate hydratase AcnA [Mycolicibacterium]|uniref:aconitate hydratase AcnA n=1 Tax=Mycolicibacterium TaxID=1866885 RepID=UPI00093C8F88|nr:aconitate hydratase AcnA [Mycolicibacterium mageritense]OKH80514.1 aconitate hydratase [Mycobacterium sp. SWH-M3]GJJ20892.1 aconitate hydratase [Mycolicibacterium mageritense]